MGVPAFYRWLVGKYPKIVVNAKEERGEGIIMDTTSESQPNPNGEFDHLYLDMNGIIHPCFHPDNTDNPPMTVDEVFMSIFEYIDRIFRIVRPRKLLYMAIDGVAPRAKMNQQRARRFQTAKSVEISEAEEDKLRKEFDSKGKRVLPKQHSEVSDSNVITPGTEFMDNLSKALKYYIHLRLNTDPGWKKIKVILSDANVPGEGEHKIMSFIRLQRNLDGYNPDTRHCLCGLDADLIMLALATHEIHFSILREDVLMNEPSLEISIKNMNINSVKSRGWFGKNHTSNGRLPKKPYQFLHIWTLREYLKFDLEIADPSSKINFERIVDDFIFLCFLVGNDFLPNLPTLEIHEGAIDLLMAVYKQEFKGMGGYLIDTQRLKAKKACYIKQKRLERFITAVGSYEDQIFQKRSELRKRKLQRILREMAEEDKEEEEELYNVQEDLFNQANAYSPVFHNGRDYFGVSNVKSLTPRRVEPVHVLEQETFAEDHMEDTDVLKNTKELRQRIKDLLREKSDIFKHGTFPIDKVKLGNPDWKQRYYKEKFSAETPEQIERTRKDVVQKYVEGLCWVLRYYFEGVCSWTWYYKYHYGPFASDFKGFSCSNASFQMGFPFKPFAQLMAVLPPRSAHALPEAYGQLMTCEDSKIRDLYPSDFEVDTDGKRYMWQGVTKLPFIEEKLLLQEIEKVENKLTDDEVGRNSVSFDKIFVRESHELGSQVVSIYGHHKNTSEKGLTQAKVPIDFQNSGGLNGFLRLDEYSSIHNFISPVKGMEDITEDNVLFAMFENPTFHDHIPELTQNVTMPEEEITENDIEEIQLWHTYKGSRPTVSRVQYKQRFVKETENEGKAADLSTARERWKGAGSGWGCGRGKGYPEVLNSSRNSDTWTGIEARNRNHGESQNLSLSNGSYNSRGSAPAFASYGRGRGYGSAGYPNIRQSPGNSGFGQPRMESMADSRGSAPAFASYGYGRGNGRGNGSAGLPNVRQHSGNCGFGQPRREIAANSNNWWRVPSQEVTSFGRGEGRGYLESSSSNLKWIAKPSQVAPVRGSRNS